MPFLEGTTIHPSNPVIEFHQDTIYTVRLDLSVWRNASLPKHLKLNQETISIFRLNQTWEQKYATVILKICKFEASGADSFSWSILSADMDKIALSSPYR